MQEGLRAAIKPMARLGIVAILAITAIAAIQPLTSPGGEVLAADAVPLQAELSAPQQAEPDEGGTGVNNFDREEWYQFAILLAPFLVLVTFILILMFGWDRFTSDED